MDAKTGKKKKRKKPKKRGGPVSQHDWSKLVVEGNPGEEKSESEEATSGIDTPSEDESEGEGEGEGITGQGKPQQAEGITAELSSDVKLATAHDATRTKKPGQKAKLRLSAIAQERAEEQEQSTFLVKSGIATKQGHWRKSWKPRYFELYRDYIVYYASKGGEQKGRMAFHADDSIDTATGQLSVVLAKDMSSKELQAKPNCIQIVFGDGPSDHGTSAAAVAGASPQASKLLLVDLLSERERDEWVAAIRTCAEHAEYAMRARVAWRAEEAAIKEAQLQGRDEWTLSNPVVQQAADAAAEGRSWQNFSGRSSGGSGYRFGDLTRGAASTAASVVAGAKGLAAQPLHLIQGIGHTLPMGKAKDKHAADDADEGSADSTDDAITGRSGDDHKRNLTASIIADYVPATELQVQPQMRSELLLRRKAVRPTSKRSSKEGAKVQLTNDTMTSVDCALIGDVLTMTPVRSRGASLSSLSSPSSPASPASSSSPSSSSATAPSSSGSTALDGQQDVKVTGVREWNGKGMINTYKVTACNAATCYAHPLTC
jgi:hypothetical protein